jgi:drug/metabolite transporter (DMT)-like permease
MGTESTERDGNGATLAAFLLMVLLAGGNAVGVHVVVQEMDPFWAAAVRFVAAGAIFWAALLFLKVPVPTGGALVGALLYGIVGFFLAFAFAFWGLRDTPPGTAGMLLALVPLMTMLLARLHGLERVRLRAVVGSLAAVAGVGLLLVDRVSTDVPILSLLAMLASAACFAETGVLLKLTPRAHAVATNAVALTFGGVLLGLLSAAVGEDWAWPVLTDSLLAMAFLIVGGSVGVFGLYVFVLQRWSASAVSYEFLLIPVVTAIYAVIFTGEIINWALVAGGALILAGVYLGAVAPGEMSGQGRQRPEVRDPAQSGS